jgi:uncharacterized membrane protein YhaH (DUF805 family)
MTNTPVPTERPIARRMTFDESITTVFRKYADFEGTATRAELWWFVLFTTLVSMAFNGFNILTLDGPVQIGTTLAYLWGIAILVPSLAVTVRRLRDAGRTWPELFWLLLPIVGPIILIIHLCDPSRTRTDQVTAERPPQPSAA